MGRVRVWVLQLTPGMGIVWVLPLTPGMRIVWVLLLTKESMLFFLFFLLLELVLAPLLPTLASNGLPARVLIPRDKRVGTVSATIEPAFLSTKLAKIFHGNSLSFQRMRGIIRMPWSITRVFSPVRVRSWFLWLVDEQALQNDIQEVEAFLAYDFLLTTE